MNQDTGAPLQEWLAKHDQRLVRFRDPVSLSEVAFETKLTVDEIQSFLLRTREPLYHAWPHRHGTKSSRSKSYCLRLNGPDTVGLDWEDSVVGAVEHEFRRRGFETCRELGTDEDLDHIFQKRSLAELNPRVNQRDLWAMRNGSSSPELWIIEAKGKEAAEFDHYCLAEALSQLFVVPADILTDLLGSRKPDSHGLCWHMARRIHDSWARVGVRATITVAILVPDWRPDILWKGGALRRIDESFYSRPLSALYRFLDDGSSDASSGRYKYQRAFGRMLDTLESEVNLRRLCAATEGLRFRVLTTDYSSRDNAFRVSGLD
jgi:hypothetical protein